MPQGLSLHFFFLGWSFAQGTLFLENLKPEKASRRGSVIEIFQSFQRIQSTHGHFSGSICLFISDFQKILLKWRPFFGVKKLAPRRTSRHLKTFSERVGATLYDGALLAIIVSLSCVLLCFDRSFNVLTCTQKISWSMRNSPWCTCGQEKQNSVSSTLRGLSWKTRKSRYIKRF